MTNRGTVTGPGCRARYYTFLIPRNVPRDEIFQRENDGSILQRRSRDCEYVFSSLSSSLLWIFWLLLLFCFVFLCLTFAVGVIAYFLTPRRRETTIQLQAKLRVPEIIGFLNTCILFRFIYSIPDITGILWSLKYVLGAILSEKRPLAPPLGCTGPLDFSCTYRETYSSVLLPRKRWN